MNQNTEVNVTEDILASLPSPIMTFKRYQNRKLYWMEKSRYTTLSELAAMVRKNIPLRIIDSLTKNDITANTLTQVVLQEELNKPVKSLEVITRIIKSGLTFSEYIEKNVVVALPNQAGEVPAESNTCCKYE